MMLWFLSLLSAMADMATQWIGGNPAAARARPL